MRGRSIISITAFAALAACAGHNPGTNASRPRTDPRTITAAEIEQNGASFSSLYEFVRSRHSDWLMPMPGVTTRLNSTRVYVDGSRYGEDLNAMIGIPLTSIEVARRLDPSEAQQKYGTNNNAGVIEVFTKASGSTR